MDNLSELESFALPQDTLFVPEGGTPEEAKRFPVCLFELAGLVYNELPEGEAGPNLQDLTNISTLYSVAKAVREKCSVTEGETKYLIPLGLLIGKPFESGLIYRALDLHNETKN